MLEEAEFRSIRMLVDKVVGNKDDLFVTGRVIKRDEKKKLVWLAEFGDQPIPVIGFNYKMTYYDTDADGNVQRKDSIASVIVPAVGEIVFVAKEAGVRRLPRCLGVLQGIGWLMEAE